MGIWYTDTKVNAFGCGIFDTFHFSMTRSLPFSLSVPSVPIARDEMDTVAFDAMRSEGLVQAKAEQGDPVDDAFNLLQEDIHG